MSQPARGSENPKPDKPIREWAPRFWLGCDTHAWFRLMAKGGFRWHPPHWHIGVITFFVSFFHTTLRWAQKGLYGKQIAQTKITHPPVFIIGHWRNGTTLLHELLIQDSRHNFPNTYQCMEPNHFLLTEEWVKAYFGFLMPDRRPMDNMPAGWDKPQEDEFALCMLGQSSPYTQIAFPNQPGIDRAAFDLEALPIREQKRWKKAFYGFLQTLTFKDPRRLILKSPPHTCRIKTILEVFPEARFVHIIRNPYRVFPSTVNLWKSLYKKQGMQTPNNQGIEEYVFENFLYLHEKLEDGRKLVHPSRFYELKYEDLVRDPENEMRSLYAHLDLGNFESYEPSLKQYLAERSNYETNKFVLTPELRDQITKRWGHVIEHYGYPIEPSTTHPEEYHDRMEVHSFTPRKAERGEFRPGIVPVSRAQAG